MGNIRSVISKSVPEDLKGSSLLLQELKAHKPSYTTTMIRIEYLRGIDLTTLLFSKRDSELTKELGVDKSTVCRWRKRIRWGIDR
jgi:hypothetical protein